MGRFQKPVVLALFFASGFSGLVYEVVWMRLLSLTFGNSVFASATVLGGFMGGMAIGGLIFGGVADRAPAPLRLYGILELLIGGFAGVSVSVKGVVADLPVGRACVRSFLP